MISNSLNMSGKNPKFFKIIVQDTIGEGKLAIPKKFVKEYGDSLRSHTVLKVPDGRKWKMAVSKNNAKNYEGWLGKGWKEFEKHYSIKCGYLLVFEYHQHKSNFLVFIFDPTLLEIRFPVSGEHVMEQKQQHCSPLNVKVEDEEFQGKLKESKGGNKRGRKRNSESTTSQALEAAHKCSLSNPSFIVILKSNHHGRISMAVAIGFIREHMECKTQQIILTVEGKLWAVKMNVYAKHGRAAMSAGWSLFAKDNSLKDEDVCVFELVKNNMFQVHIFRHA